MDSSQGTEPSKVLYPTERQQGTDSKSAWAMACKTYDTYSIRYDAQKSPQLSGLARCPRLHAAETAGQWKYSLSGEHRLERLKH